MYISISVQTSMETTGPGNFTNNIVNNLYTPPAVDEKIMTKTLKAEYIDFDTLLPTSIPTTDQQLIGIQVISEDNFHITTNHKQKNKITDFPSWMCEWNLFTQATLYNHPQQQHNLFSYQKHFCYLIRRFKFEACYIYDNAQRKQNASQIRVPSTSHTAMWDKRNEELYNIFLMDSSSHLPTYYICKNTGHYSSYCPQKQSDNLPFTRTQTQKQLTPPSINTNLWVSECDQPTKPYTHAPATCQTMQQTSLQLQAHLPQMSKRPPCHQLPPQHQLHFQTLNSTRNQKE